jgi:sugar O-acyltransferase (sialic acid O-acetyltransferase NeuD family)
MPSFTQPAPVVIWGAGGHAKVVAEILSLQGGFEIAGFLDDVHLEKHGTDFCGSKILGGCELLPSLHADGVRHLALAVGNCQARLHMLEAAHVAAFELVRTLHPSSIISPSAEIGCGSVVAVIGPDARIGRAVIVNTCASVDHDCHVGDAVHHGPGTRLADAVRIGVATYLGVGSVVKGAIRIGSKCTIASGSTVISDLPSN